MLAVDILIQGLIQGSIYALIALGLTLVYGLLRILHVAHASLFTLGGYLGVLVTNATGSLFLALVLAMLVVGFVGMASYRIIYRPLLSRPPLIALIASIGVFHCVRRSVSSNLWPIQHLLPNNTITKPD